MEYSPHVYTSPTLVTTPFHVFWEAGHDRVFLVSEPGLLKKDLVNSANLKQATVTMQCIYAIHTMILTPLGIDCPPFKNSSL